MERIFGNGSGGGAAKYSAPQDEDTVEEYHARISAIIDDARDYNDTYLSDIREENTEYYKGIEPALDEEGRSTIVATEVRDTVMAMMPSLMRIFTSHEHVVEYTPRTENDVELAKQATDYVSYVFWEDNPGYLILHGAFKDALIRRTGIITWDTKVKKETRVKTYKNIDAEQVALMTEMSAGATNIDVKDLKNGKFTLIATFETQDSIIVIEGVAPDEFRVDRNARTIETADLIGFERLVPGSQLIADGYDRELVDKHRSASSTSRWNAERSLRNPALDETGGARDTNDGYVLYGEYYIMIDSDDDGIAELHLICTMGDENEVVSDEMVDRRKIAIFCPEPEPHTLIGESTAELVMDLQKIKTGIMRSSLDSLAATIYPRLAVNESTTNMDDVLNNETGAPIRTKGPPDASIKQMGHVFVGEPAFNMLNYLDMTRQQRTGISDASKGLDPKALQSTNVKGVDMVITGAQERIELVARNFCETGMKTLFKGLLQEITDNPPKERIVRLRDKFVPVQADQYDPTMDVRVNPAIGRGTDMDRMLILSQVKQTQEMIITQMGVSNPIVGPEEYRNTLADMLAIANIKDVSRYFKVINPQELAVLAENLAKQKDPATMLAEAEVEKIRASTAKAIGQQETDRSKAQADDDFRRDKLEVDTAVKLLELGVNSDISTLAEETRAATAGNRDSMVERMANTKHLASAIEADTAREHSMMDRSEDRDHASIEKTADREHALKINETKNDQD